MVFISPSITLYPSGAELPQIGFGTWKHVGPQATEAVYSALKVGYRLIDCAADYANEAACGAGLRKAIDENIVSRSDVWVVSKLWNTFHHKQHVREAVLKSLKDWGVEYFDLYYVHFPISLAYVSTKERYPPGWFFDDKQTQVIQDPVPLYETWRALEELVDEGLIRHLGISNMSSVIVTDLLSYARIKPEVLQVEIHPYNAQPKLLGYARTQMLAVTAYSSFGPLGFRALNMPKALDAQPLFTHPVITEIAANHHDHSKGLNGKVHKSATPAQVILKWALQRGLAVIPKSDDRLRMEENIRVGLGVGGTEGESSEGGFVLSNEEMERISRLDIGLRFNDPSDDFGCYIFC
ncbi:NADPH-dependent D-xylose reductase [Gloeophyllum trabeum ATCC 11539]|uniref:NADPH-dependent D-xylose reductase n=1 Tax=Gloeophyllum trabeum (strain ATCC 11539 / FP-39264 / Madison 617) TaxID=670483 RepID=S7RXD8_GLOTA|nr:NADPH-dependent D-xylose reductase [Gloeophyllum trabeum ATCC 11539]EPQ57999.1 NADPH-dependent D-xylose reductase [Gloeophyllum trabeum ATCC 11539]